LDGIFLTPGPQSWGYRNRNDGKRYIALSTTLWSGNPPTALALDQYENRVFGPPLSWTAQIDTASPPIYLPATPNNAAILAALAHEFGHVLWADILISPRFTPPQSGRFCSGILSQAWSGGLQFAVWTAFEDRDTNPANIADDLSDPPSFGDPGPSEAKVLKMWNALQHNVARAHRILWRILALGRPFPSLLGAFSANEQFVESFTLYTLMGATTPLTSLPLQVSPGLIRDIPATISQRKRLSKALKCFDTLFNPHRP
jgi:hypothetical protein